jgi:hypothetical protein
LLIVGLVQLDELAVEVVGGVDLVGTQPCSFALLMKYWTFFGGYFSSSTFAAFISRLIADSWSAVSRIWNVCGRPASRQCARSIRLHRPWNVPIHMPRVSIGSIADSRAIISRAACW